VTDKTKESLSALIDDEASEIEVHKLLRLFKSKSPAAGETASAPGTLHRSWASYQEIRSVVSSSGESVRLTANQHLELRLRISDAIEAEDTYQLEGQSSLAASAGATQDAVKSGFTRYRAPAAGLAIAASLVVAVFVGLTPAGDDSQPQGTLASSEPLTSSSAPISVQTVSTQSARQSAATTSPELNSLEQRLLSSGEEGMLVDQSELKELNEAQRQQMREYLQLHDRMTRSNPNRRTVKFNSSNR